MNWLDNLLASILPGYKTYFAGAGLCGLALYQFSTKDYQGASQSFLAGLAALGLRSAVAKQAAP